jgi:two-component system response regulator DevR
MTPDRSPAEPKASLMPQRVRVFLVDDHELVRRGIADVLESDPRIEVVGEASTAEQAKGRILAVQPDVALLDVKLPGASGIDLCRDLKTAAPDVACVMLTAYDDDEAMTAAVIADAMGYALKDIRGSGLIDTVLRVASGRSALDPMTVRLARARLQAGPSVDPRIAQLNTRERQVLELIADGLSNRQIGTRLGLTEKTVKNYTSNLLGKLGLQSRTQAAIVALESRAAAEHEVAGHPTAPARR